METAFSLAISTSMEEHIFLFLGEGGGGGVTIQTAHGVHPRCISYFRKSKAIISFPISSSIVSSKFSQF